jgi:hypothetical protein
MMPSVMRNAERCYRGVRKVLDEVGHVQIALVAHLIREPDNRSAQRLRHFRVVAEYERNRRH